MKFLTGLMLCAAPLQAQIYADVSTTMGGFTVELYHEDSPMTVANFIGLAEGSKNWINSTTGEVKKNQPYYNGIIFHRVIAGFMNQVGSPKGDGTDGPGYTFPDEVSNGVLHDKAYLLSSANSGPNTNGSQMFITVDATPWLDGVHTVFGKVTVGTDIIDSINQVAVSGNTPVTEVSITDVQVRRVGPEANAFDVSTQGVPEVSEASIQIELSSEGTPQISFDQQPGTSLNFLSSPDLISWDSSSRYLSEQNLSISEHPLENLSTRAFFNQPSIITWGSKATFPSALENFIITINSNLGSFIIDLGNPATIKVADGEPSLIDLSRTTITTDGFGASFLIFSEGLVPIQLRLGADLPITSEPAGRMTGTAFIPLNTRSLTGTFLFTQKP